MKSFITFSIPAIAMATAVPASAGTIAGCIASNEDRNGILSFDDYAVAKSEAGDVDGSLLREAAENELRERNRDPGRIICQTYSGAGHYVVVAGGVEYNGRVRTLIGFGFGDTRAEALARSDDRLNDIVEYNAFHHSGGEMTVVEEGRVGS
ncbi:hypothetical protein [Parasphingopyxis sp.]|uniref:hypothetical protein n=1 Tax=Parasphingopyxis sp. TaxID=1920299 RepID=UPI0026173FDA|nr:hypothetical protein [Parasphingopyxis sp.]